MPSSRLWGLVLALVLLGACAPAPPPPPAPLPASQAGQVLAALAQRRQGLTSLVLQGEILAQTSAGELSGEHLIQAKFPDQLRVQVMGPFGRPALLIVCDGQRMVVVDYQGNRALVGTASRANLARFLALPLKVEEALLLISGLPPQEPKLLPLVGPGPQAGQTRLKLVEPGASYKVRYTLDLAPADLTPLRAWFWAGQEIGPLTCEYAQPLTQAGLVFPRRVELNRPGQGKVLLENDQVRFNQTLDPQMFSVTLPPGLAVETLP